MPVEETVQTMIDEARADADQAQLYAEVASNIAIDAARDLASFNSVGDLSPYLVVPVDSDIPDLELIYKKNYDLNILNSINTEYLAFLEAYYPSALADSAATWIQGAIDDGGTGLPASIEDAIWQRGRDRLGEDLNARVQQASDQFARAGFVNPPGALMDQIAQAQEERSVKACELNRDIAIAQAELEQKNIQFAVEQATGLQKAVWASAAQLIGVLIGAYEAANTHARDVKNAAKEFYEASMNYSRLLLALEEFKKQFSQTDLDIDLNEVKLDIDVVNERAKRVTDAALGIAGTMSSIAASALSGQNTLGTLLAEE